MPYIEIRQVIWNGGSIIFHFKLIHKATIIRGGGGLPNPDGWGVKKKPKIC